MKLSVVIPVYNEAENVPLLVKELAAIAAAFDAFEVLLVDDGSVDETWEAIVQCASNFEFLRGIRCVENRGQTPLTYRNWRVRSRGTMWFVDTVQSGRIAGRNESDQSWPIGFVAWSPGME